MVIPAPLYAAGLLVLAAGALGLRRLRGHDHRIGIALLLTLAVACDMVGERTLRDELAATRVARLVSGRDDVSVRCIGWFNLDRLVHSSAEGWVQFDADGRAADVATVDAGQCRTFHHFVSTGKVDQKTVVAVEVVIHESVHLSGVTDEAETMCRGLAATPKVVQALGKDPKVGLRIVNTYLHVTYGYMPEEYQRPDRCAAELTAAGVVPG